MMNRLIISLIATFFVCFSMLANEEHNISLEKGDENEKVNKLPYGIFTFKLVESHNCYRVLISLENTPMSQAILLFKDSMGEKSLKKNKPKIEFVKRYSGSKGERYVHGCKELDRPLIAIIPEEKMAVCSIEVSPTNITKLELPIYFAKYDANKCIKKGPYNITYKILNEEILCFNIEVKGWSENDPDYIAAKSAVDEYIRSVNTATFCRNKRHKPSLAQQQRSYREKNDSLVNVIDSTLQAHSEWYSTDLPHIKYSELLTQLNDVNLKEHIYDCGKHNVAQKHRPCNYCSLSAQQIYHHLDDIYQQLRAGKLKKDTAVKKARSLNTCYQNSTKRKKDASYTDKISNFYSRIVNY